MNRIATLFLLLPAGLAFSQDAPIVNKGTTEIGGFVGASYGTQNFQVMSGGNVSYAITKAIMPYAEFSYFPGLPITKDLSGNVGRTPTPRPLPTIACRSPISTLASITAFRSRNLLLCLTACLESVSCMLLHPPTNSTTPKTGVRLYKITQVKRPVTSL